MHLGLSALFGVIFSLLVPRLRTNGSLLLAAGVYGLVVYLGNFRILSPWLFPVFQDADQPFEVLVHVLCCPPFLSTRRALARAPLRLEVMAMTPGTTDEDPVPAARACAPSSPASPEVGDDPRNHREDPVPRPTAEILAGAIGGDVDEAGHRLVLYVARVEHRDGKDRLVGSVAVEEIVGVRVRRRLTSHTLEVADHQRTLRLKGVRSGAAATFRDRWPSAGWTSTDALDRARRPRPRRCAGSMAGGDGLRTDEQLAAERAAIARRDRSAGNGG